MIDKLQKKFGRYAVPNLMKYVVMLYILGFLVSTIGSAGGVDVYSQYLSFNVDKILHGQIWRVVTFLIQSPDNNLFFMFIEVYLYYMIGTNLERAWGTFRFNLFYVSGVVFNIIAAVFIYVFVLILTGGALHINYPISLEYINLSMFFAFSTIFSDVELLLFFVLPIKIKYISWAYAAIELYGLVQVYMLGGWVIGLCQTIVLVISLANFLIYFLGDRRRHGRTFKEKKRRRNFERSFNAGMNGGYTSYTRGNSSSGSKIITRHKCAVCGRTELDDPDLEFRFCSKCDGNYEYCMVHLYTHQHVVREYTNQKNEQ